MFSSAKFNTHISTTNYNCYSPIVSASSKIVFFYIKLSMNINFGHYVHKIVIMLHNLDSLVTLCYKLCVIGVLRAFVVMQQHDWVLLSCILQKDGYLTLSAFVLWWSEPTYTTKTRISDSLSVDKTNHKRCSQIHIIFKI